MAKQVLIPKSANVPTLDATANLSIEEQFVHVKLFNPAGVGNWYITAYDPTTEEAFGFVNLDDPEMAELGYISIPELKALRLPFGLSVERDAYFTKTPLKEVMDTIRNGGHV